MRPHASVFREPEVFKVAEANAPSNANSPQQVLKT
jgi:hypothetical protein